MRIFSTIIVLAIILIGLTFAILNSSPVVLNYYFGQSEISLSLLLASTLGFGAAIGLLLFSPTFFKLKKGNLVLKHRIKQVEKEVENLRAIPIKDSH